MRGAGNIVKTLTGEADDLMPSADDEQNTNIPTCEDTDMEFDITGTDIVDKDCTWLASNRYTGLSNEDICDYTHVAYRCPVTCDACDVDFAQE